MILFRYRQKLTPNREVVIMGLENETMWRLQRLLTIVRPRRPQLRTPSLRRDIALYRLMNLIQ
jgi:hypothetical protein